jgi:hypothetical protein
MRIDHPYNQLTPASRWLRGNLHTHTTASDGERPHQAVIDDYAARGYHFLMISDHDVYTSLDNYAKLDPKGLILIPGNEVTANGEHLLHVNAGSRVEPTSDRQQIIDAINRHPGQFAIMNHPNWYREWNHCTQENLERWQGYRGIEIFNGVIGRLEGSQFAADRWDRLLTKGRRVWGYAHDDSHAAKGDVELGWNVVYLNDPSVNTIVDALAHGRFYASTGVVISRIKVHGTRIRIDTENADRIIATADGQRRVAVVDAKSIELDVAGLNDQYLRFECCGHGEQFAWTQPFFLTK